MKADLEHPDSPFAGCGPQPVRCRWLSGEDAVRAPTAEVVRLLVDDARGDTHWPNDVYQRNVLREVCDFIGPSVAVLATPAGMVTAAIPWPDYSPASLATSLEAVRAAAARLAPAPGDAEVLLGLDGCVPGEATPLQAIVPLAGTSAGPAVVKLYPAGGEKDTLLGWALCRAADAVPPDLAQARRASTRAGVVLPLVCHEAAIFSGRSRAVLKDALGLRIRRHFLEQARPGAPAAVRPDGHPLAGRRLGADVPRRRPLSGGGDGGDRGDDDLRPLRRAGGGGPTVPG